MEILTKILDSFEQGKWVIEDVKDRYEAITSLSETARTPDKEEFRETLAKIHKIFSFVKEGTVLENEEYWFAFSRFLEILTSRMWVVCLEEKKIILELNTDFFLVACDLQRVYSYFKLNELAVQRSVDYDNFRGVENRKTKVSKFIATKEEDIKHATEQEYVLPYHIKEETGRLVNDGFLPLKIDNSVLKPNNSASYEGKMPIHVVGADLFISTTAFPSAISEATFEGVTKIINGWNPSETRRYEEAEKAELSEYLRKFFKDVKEEKGESDADIVVDKKVPIETKIKPDKSELDRLTGQVTRHKKEFGFVIVVIFRIVRNNLYEEWRESYARDEAVNIIEK